MREGGVSEGPYASLNLGSHVQDDLDKVFQNRALLFTALAPSVAESEEALIVPKQMHGDTVLAVEAVSEVTSVQSQAAEGADGIIVSAREVGALLCFADCVPVIIVLPTGRFAVVHAGWRGVKNEISAKALDLMLDQERQEHGFSRSELAAQTNVYIGPYIHRECFETGADVHALFVAKFGEECRFDDAHIELPCAFSSLRAASTRCVSAIWAVARYVRMIVSSPSERKMACRVATVRSRSVSNVVYGSAAYPRPFLGCDIVG